MEISQTNVFIEEENMYDNNKLILEVDPLDGIGDDSSEKYYRLNTTVFAEPVAVNTEHVEGMSKQADECQFTFMDRVIVQKNPNKKNRKFHIDVDKSSLICPQENCGKSFKSQTLLKAHIRKVHCAVCMFVCDVCGVSCTAKYLLIRHMAVHERKTVECPVCKKMLSVRTRIQFSS
ncbi:myc-associated zinc finger protein-like [Zerene cesonia]|uniref:myc-associated zinc finger protein-like n=1 Tax=Zerene cesonia TaxID=33412 RepID=UPI0018E56478|nr:myc-associated zinc finger protein-like [Zerene cesonia]